MDEIDKKFMRTAEMLLDVNAKLLALCTLLALNRLVDTDELDKETRICREEMREKAGI